MTFIVISMVVIVAVAGLVVAFTAFPHRGEEMPGVPWLGEAMDRAAGVLPTLDDGEQDETRSLVGRLSD
ncbi:hypothetical protein [Nocardioides aestuarii]|uniref:Uncharacterized protein n=1 Tax=Nocardioides aestuarii TaxID=252231 RepID=A0ABW4TGR4_9ACTN